MSFPVMFRQVLGQGRRSAIEIDVASLWPETLVVILVGVVIVIRVYRLVVLISIKVAGPITILRSHTHRATDTSMS